MRLFRCSGLVLSDGRLLYGYSRQNGVSDLERKLRCRRGSVVLQTTWDVAREETGVNS